MAKRPDLAHGKAFEKLVHDAFRSLYETYPILWERVLDTHDAGNIVRKADSDFKLMVKSDTPGRPWLYHIECKASIRFNSLTDGGARRSLIKPDQIAKLRLAIRAGAGALILFHSVNQGIIEVWGAQKVIEAWGKKRYRWTESPAAEVPVDEFADWVKSMVEGHFNG